MEIKARLIDLLQRAHEQEQTFVAGLTGDERSAVGAPERWSAKDIVAHLAEWKARMGQRLAAARRDETPPRYDDIDRTNADIFEQHRSLSWADVLSESKRAQGELIKQMQALPEDVLVDAQRFSWQNGQPLWRGIAGNGYSHPLAHLAQFYIERGDLDCATQIQETAAQLLMSLDDSPDWRGVTIYNLACHYALSGQKEKAIAKLGEALGMNPGLVEWSKQDSDLVSIRAEPAYQALYTS